jgi:ATP-binding cassette subfamily B multidrug efflux pump
MNGPMGMGKSLDRVSDLKGTVKNLIKYLEDYHIALIFVLILAISSTTFTIVGPKILGGATTELFKGIMAMIAGTGAIDFDKISGILIFLLGLYVLSAALGYAQNFIMTSIATKVSFKMRRQISDKINVLPLKYFDKNTTGEVLSRITNDVDVINQSLNQSVSQIITSIVSVIGILYMMISISLSMTLVSLLVLPLSMIFVVFVMKKSQKYFKEQQEHLGKLNGHIEEMYSSHLIIKAFNKEDYANDIFEESNSKLFSSAWKGQFISGMLFPIMNFIGNLGYVVISVMGGYFAIHGNLSIGDIQAFIQYMRQFTQPIAQLANISNVIQQTLAASERVFIFLNEEEQEAETANPIEIKDAEVAVEFKDVHFGYNEDKIIINNFSTKVLPGQKIAIVGPTGAGKTTLVKLLMRFYELNSGSILVDGVNIRDLKRHDLRSMFGMVLQDTWLYNASIKDNIKYGKQDATDEEIINASKMAQVDHFVRTLPNDYDMVILEEANNISQGEKQLLTIARAILSDPKILILDEATSSVDTRTEVLIQKAMDALMHGRTSFIIAHRLSTIRNADHILVMNNGDIVEQGNHEELLAKDGFYAKLYNSQFEEV